MANVIDARRELWSDAEPSAAHPLRGLIGRRVGAFRIRLFEGPRSRFGAKYFRLHLEDHGGQCSREPVILGLYNGGRYPSENWIETVGVSFTATFGELHRCAVAPETSAVGREIWRLLGESIPPGGHLMVEYESPEWRDSERGLARGLPPVTTPLGHLLFRVGCGVNFKDWYYPEGLHEGPRKLQGWKALDAEHRRRRAGGMADELREFLARPAPSLMEKEARRRARAVLLALERA